MRIISRTILLFVLVVAISGSLAGQLPQATADRIDAIANQALADTGAPSDSVAVVKDGKIAYVKAYGNARLEPATAASPEMRYSIGSVSKQFLAGALLLLVQEGKLSLDDRVGRFLPSLTRASDITLRQLLSHTSGYQDYYPLDYVAPFMLDPVTAEGILDRWAKKPLDFEPGSEWQYSNTNYVVAGRILEKVAGIPLMALLESRIFRPLGMQSPIDLDAHPLTGSDAAGYTRFGLGPLRPAQPEARGWLYAAGELAMTARDLAVWDQSLLEGKLLKSTALQEMMKPARLNNGAPINYALGVGISNASGHPRLGHSGAVSGFVSANAVWLDEGIAAVALTNLDGSGAARAIVDQIGAWLLAEKLDPRAAQPLEQARQVFSELQQGRIDRSLLTSDADAYFTSQVLADAAASLKPLGTPQSFNQTSFGLRGGMTYRNFRIGFASGKSLDLTTFSTPDGKLAQYLIQ
jgi:CubicO group peptidase (beta-lactamase class C family)